MYYFIKNGILEMRVVGTYKRRLYTMMNKKIISLLFFSFLALFILFISVQSTSEDIRQETKKTTSSNEGSPEKNALHKARVIRVVDGDTIHVLYKGKKEKVRLIGIDTPESVHPNKARNSEEGKIASRYTKTKLLNKDIFLEFDVQRHDKYNRLLAYVWIDSVMFNKQLLHTGMARVSTYPPNVKHVDSFLRIQEDAKNNKRGFWDNNFFSATTTKNKPSQKGSSSSVIPGEGLIKGNKNSMIYHVPGGYHYDAVKNNIEFFKTEEEAQKAGYRRAKR